MWDFSEKLHNSVMNEKKTQIQNESNSIIGCQGFFLGERKLE